MAKRKMKIRTWRKGEGALVKAIVFHPMETGMRKNKTTGDNIPAHYIEQVVCELNGKTILTCLWGVSMSKNPFLSFNIKKVNKGDTLQLSWVDNQGNRDTAQAEIK